MVDSINNLELHDDQEMNIDWGRDADQAPPPPPDGTYKVTVDFQEADELKRWGVKFMVPNPSGKGAEVYDVVKIEGAGPNGVVTVKERKKRGEEESGEEFEFNRNEGQLYITTGLVLTIIGCIPDKKTGAVPDENLWLGRKVFANIDSRLSKEKTSKATDFIKSVFPLATAKTATSSEKMKKLITQAVVGQLPAVVALHWEGQTESFNQGLEWNQVPRGMKNFPENAESPYGRDSVVEKEIGGAWHEFKARAGVKHWVPNRAGQEAA